VDGGADGEPRLRAPSGLGAPLLKPAPRRRAGRAGGRVRAAGAAVLLAGLGLACASASEGPRAAPPAAGDPAAPDTTTLLFGGAPPLRLQLDGVVGGYGAGAGQMAYPEGVAVDDLGRLFVADTGNDRLLRFDQAGVFLGEAGGFGFEPGRFDKPRDLVINRSLGLWVLDGENARVVKYDLEGRLIGTVVDFKSGEAQGLFGRVIPGGLGGEPGGYLYVTDVAGDRVISLSPLGGGVTVLGGFGSQPGRFRHPSGVTVSGRGSVLVADGGNARVQALDTFGGFLRAWPLSGEHADGRVSVCWLAEGRLAIAERDSSRITVMSSDGRVVARLEAAGSRPGEIDHPSALATDRLGRLYVADTNNHRIQVFRLADRSAAPRR